MGMPAPAQQKVWTADEVRAMQDELHHWPRYELIDGELLVTNAPSLVHQVAVQALLRALDLYLRAHTVGRVFVSPADIELRAGNITQPDVFVVPLVDRRGPREWAEVKALLVAAEVLSPSTARYDRVKKRTYYQERGVPEYWIIDTDARLVERWRPGDARPELVEQTLLWHPEGAAEPFTLDLPRYFAEVHDEQ